MLNNTLNKLLKRLHYPLEVMLTFLPWQVAYPLSLRRVEEMMQERGVFVDHSTVHRWAIKVVPVLAAIFRRCKRPVGSSWLMVETSINLAGQWKYLYRTNPTESALAALYQAPSCWRYPITAAHRSGTRPKP